MGGGSHEDRFIPLIIIQKEKETYIRMQARDNENIHQLVVDDKEILLVGTAHVSRESAELVARLIREEAPDTVCVELCPSRFQTIKHKEQWRQTDIMKVIKEKKSFLLLSNLLLASFQRRIAQKMDISPGAEMVAAIEAAEETGAQIHLADRDIRVTLSRTWHTMSTWDKMKILYHMILSLGEIDEIGEQEIERMKQEDILESILADVGQSLPVLKSILIDERDVYLAQKIKTAPGRKVVAVVGAGHVPGIRKHWDTDTDIAGLETIPPGGRMGQVMKWLLPGLIVLMIVLGFFYGGSKTGAEMAFFWVATTGICAGVGAIMALGHPLTILSAVVAAPLTCLHPMVAAGWVSGLCEAFLRKPRVLDFEGLMTDILSFRGFWRNNVTRVLLVVVFTNLGASVGTFVAIPLMVKVIH